MRSPVDHTYEGGILSADDDRQIILGSALLSELDDCPQSQVSQAVLALLNETLTDANERALFCLPPLLPPDNRIVPLNRRR